MREKIFNLEMLVSVEINDKKRYNLLEYRPFKKSFWGDRKEGFYHAMSSYCYSKEEIEKGGFCDIVLLVEDNIVFFKPYVRLTFAGGQTFIKEFETIEAAVEWGNFKAKTGIEDYRFRLHIEN